MNISCCTMTLIHTVHPADKNLTMHVTVAVSFNVREVVPGTDLDQNTN